MSRHSWIGAFLIAFGMFHSLGASLSAQEGMDKIRQDFVQGNEERRTDSPETWKEYLKPGQSPAILNQAAVALGRVGSAKLSPVLADVLSNDAFPWKDRGWQRSVAIAVALQKEPAHLLALSQRVGVRDLCLAIGGVGKLPEAKEARSQILSRALSEDAWASESEGIQRIEDPVVARLLYLERLSDLPELDAEIRRALESKTPRRISAGLHALGRRPEIALSASWFRALTRHVSDPTSAVGGLAARALGRLKGAGENEATVIGFCLEQSAPRPTQVLRLQSLSQLPLEPALAGITKQIRSGDSYLQRSALDLINGHRRPAGLGLKPDDMAALAAFTLILIDNDPSIEVRASAIGALARLTPSEFLKRRAGWRLAGSWQMRAAAASAYVRLLNSDLVKGATARVRNARWAGVAVLRKDPDRRVVLATLAALESIASKATDVATLKRCQQHHLECRYESYLKSPSLKAAAISLDPAVRAAMATLMTSVLKSWRRLEPKGGAEFHHGFLKLLVELPLPEEETEVWLAILDFATEQAKQGERLLAKEHAVSLLQSKRFSSEPSLRQKAMASLKALGHFGEQASGVLPKAAALPVENLELELRRQSPARRQKTATLHTTRGKIKLRFFPETAPVAVGNFVTLAKAGYYDGILWHRVVPAFVAQAGCPRGDGWGGPGYSIPCEISDFTYRRGTLGMALAGKDTGGSQWFLCHTAQPHLDLRYTIFGEVQGPDDLKVLAQLKQGDVILRVSF